MKLTQSKKDALIKKTETIIGKIQELAWSIKNVTGANAPSEILEAGHKIKEVQKFILNQ